MEYRAGALQVQSHCVQPCVSVFCLLLLYEFLQRGSLDKQELTEVEVVSDGSALAVYGWMWLAFAVGHAVMVGIYHERLSLLCHSQQALHSALAHRDGAVLGGNEYVVSLCCLRYLAETLCGGYAFAPLTWVECFDIVNHCSVFIF